MGTATTGSAELRVHPTGADRELVEEILKHHGVKGQKWGVRRGRSSGGGGSHPKSSDAERAHASKEVVKKHGTDALSNHDLQHLVNRMNLEQNYSRLTSQGKSKSAGAKFASDILLNVGKQQVTKLVNDQINAQLKK